MLNSRKELREMPFSVPDGYFDRLNGKICADAAHAEGSTPIWNRVAPYAAMAAMFVLIALAGQAVIHQQERNISNEAEEDSFFYTQIMPVSGLEEIYETGDGYIAESGLSDEDIVEYLIYSGLPVESINAISHE